MIFIIILLVITNCILLYLYFSNKNKQYLEVIDNKLQKEENDLLVKEYNKLQSEITKLNEVISERQEYILSINRRIDTLVIEQENFVKERTDKEYALYKADLEKTFNEITNDLTKQSKFLLAQIEKEQMQVNALKAKQEAYIKEQQRKEEMEKKKDYYRLVLSEEEIQDIQALRSIQNKFSKKESIDKIIWENYIKPAYDILMPHLFSAKDKVCGIYKITSLIDGKAYIGQSVDIRERFRQHIKTAISCAPSTNKLYQEMKSRGLENFTFEILEEVSRASLNEREVYWIDLYKTKEFGLNKTSGGS